MTLDPLTFVGDPMVWGPAWIALDSGRAHRRVIQGTDVRLNRIARWLSGLRPRPAVFVGKTP